MGIEMKIKDIIEGFFRYLLVGGTAFLVDITLLYVFKNYVFADLAETGVYIATAIGFTGGLIYNYIFCLVFVFKSAKEQDKGKSIGSFLVFGIIGAVGLLLTELGMYVGIEILAINYLIVKVIMTAIVLLWNYGVRKIVIFS
jgi:putative flippase GtrA